MWALVERTNRLMPPSNWMLRWQASHRVRWSAMPAARVSIALGPRQVDGHAPNRERLPGDTVVEGAIDEGGVRCSTHSGGVGTELHGQTTELSDNAKRRCGWPRPRRWCTSSAGERRGVVT